MTTRRLCSVPGCEKVHVSRGLCDTHRRYAVRHGLMVPGPDRRIHFDPDKIREIRRLADSMSQRALGKMFGVDRSHIGRIVRGEIYRHVTECESAPSVQTLGADHHSG